MQYLAQAAEPRAVPVHIPAAYGARLISTQEADSLPGRSPASSAGAPGRVLHVRCTLYNFTVWPLRGMHKCSTRLDCAVDSTADAGVCYKLAVSCQR